jgi:hypothetical protein
MQTSPYEIALIAGGFTIIGALIGGWVGYRNAIRLYNIAEFNKAASIFQNAFLPEIIFLKHNARISCAGSSDNLQEFLHFGYTRRHLKAFVAFRPYLSSKKKRCIDQAWQEYCCHPDNPKITFFEQYSWKVANKGKDYEKELKSLALSRIEKILEFSKHN